MNKLFNCLFLFLFYFNLSAQNGYDIRVQLDNYDQKEIILAYQFLDRYPVLDTAKINAVGEYVFQSDSLLIPGVYMLVLPPENEFVTLLINEKEQQFSVQCDAANLTSTMKIEGSVDNRLYYEYMNYLNTQVAQLNGYRQSVAESTDAATQAKFKELFNQDVDKIRQYQFDIIDKNPNSLTASLINAELEDDIPDFANADASDIPYLQYEYRKKHYFDHINMKDERLLRSEILFQKVDYYLNNLTHAKPDSINVAVDYILDLMQDSPNTFKYYLDHLMLTYASSDIVGIDAVYVHIVENYYGKGVAPWVKKEDLDEMIDDVSKRKHLLIGKKAPNIQMELRDGTPLALHDVEADFTVLYLWQPNCSHCKASMPFMKAFHEKYKNQSVEIFAACTKIGKKVPACWEYIDENEIGTWIHTVDPFLRSRFVQKYMAEKTPKIYILDKNKTIVMKGIDAEQLDEIMEYLIEEKNKKEGPSGRS